MEFTEFPFKRRSLCALQWRALQFSCYASLIKLEHEQKEVEKKEEEEREREGTGSLRQANASIKITLGLRECS